MTRHGIGASIPRREDRRYLTGDAVYTDDIELDDALHLAVVRSPYAAARIRDVDVAEATALDGVHAVYTAADIDASDAPGTVPIWTQLPGSEAPSGPITIDRQLATPTRPLLAAEEARFAGEPVAAVVGADRYVVRDAADRVDVAYDRLDATTRPTEAVAPGAPSVYDEFPDNVAFEWQCGDGDATAAAFRSAENAVSVELDHQRLIANAVEPRAAAARFDGSSGRLTVWRPTQGVHTHQGFLARILGLEPQDVRVRTPAVGGSFGNKSKAYPAECLTAWCAMQVGAPVRWQATRSEMYRSGAHGRGHETRGELAYDADGTFRGLRVESHADVGSYLSGPVAGIHTAAFAGGLSGQYRIPAIHCRVIGAFTNTPPVSSYRSTSRPQSTLLVERLVDEAARDLDIDPVVLRRRNFVPPEEFPYETPLGDTYDSGAYEATLDRALELVGYDQYRARQGDASADGRSLGIGVACAIDQAGTGAIEHCELAVDPSGEVTATCGTLDTGQGHETTYVQLVTEALGVDPAAVRITEGDTDALHDGVGTFGSRSAVAIDQLVSTCVSTLLDRGAEVAAGELEADPEDIAFDDEDASFVVRGAPGRSVSLADVAATAAEDNGQGLRAGAAEPDPPTYPYGTHVAVASVDHETGEVTIEDYAAVDDCGTIVNPLIVHGQILGGTVQGLGQALLEGAVFDESGTLLTGSLQDYALPRAADIPDIALDTRTTPSPRTANGVKGIAESGSAAAPAAVANAVVDAVAPLGEGRLRLPFTAESVWRATRSLPR